MNVANRPGKKEREAQRKGNAPARPEHPQDSRTHKSIALAVGGLEAINHANR